MAAAAWNRDRRPPPLFPCFSSLSSSNEHSSSNSSSNSSVQAPIPPMMEGWTIADTMQHSIALLEQHDVSEPEASVQQLLAHALELDWDTGVRELRHMKEHNIIVLSQQQATTYQDLLQRRLCHHEPIQYLLGQWDFLDYTIQIQPPLLCPRPETEELVLKVVEDVQCIYKDNTATGDPLHILDVGCGTGVIGIALSDQLLQQQHSVVTTAIDVDPVAIQVSQHNARRILSPKTTTATTITTTEAPQYTATLVAAQDYTPQENNKFHVVVSNPPYIPQSEVLEPQVALWESNAALFAGPDGLDVIKIILQRLPDWCRDSNDGGAICWMEVDPSHPAMMETMLVAGHYPGVQFHSSHQDLYGRDRFVKLLVNQSV